jgi:hypothetical protein
MPKKSQINEYSDEGKRRIISNILYVPDVTRNLLSVGTLTDSGLLASFDVEDQFLIHKRY